MCVCERVCVGVCVSESVGVRGGESMRGSGSAGVCVSVSARVSDHECV